MKLRTIIYVLSIWIRTREALAKGATPPCMPRLSWGMTVLPRPGIPTVSGSCVQLLDGNLLFRCSRGDSDYDEYYNNPLDLLLKSISFPSWRALQSTHGHHQTWLHCQYLSWHARSNVRYTTLRTSFTVIPRISAFKSTVPARAEQDAYCLAHGGRAAGLRRPVAL